MDSEIDLIKRPFTTFLFEILVFLIFLIFY